MSATVPPVPPKTSEPLDRKADDAVVRVSNANSADKPTIVELSIEFIFELLLFLYPYGAEQMNLPHSFWLGFGCWVAATAIAVRMFWIFPLWSHRLSRLEKGLIALIAVALFALVVHKPIETAYARRNSGDEAVEDGRVLPGLGSIPPPAAAIPPTSGVIHQPPTQPIVHAAPRHQVSPLPPGIDPNIWEAVKSCPPNSQRVFMKNSTALGGPDGACGLEVVGKTVCLVMDDGSLAIARGGAGICTKQHNNPPVCSAFYQLPGCPPVKTASQAVNQQNNKGGTNVQQNGDNNTVNIGDPRVAAQLDEITKLLKAKGEEDSPEKLFARYPLGYVIFQLDYRNEVLPYSTQTLRNRWKVDWNTVRFTEITTDKYELQLPDIRFDSGAIFQRNSIGGLKKVGPMGGMIASDGTMRMRGEILSVSDKGIIFVLGFQPDTTPAQ